MLKLKGSKVKLEASGSADSKSVKLKELKKKKIDDAKKSVVVKVGGGGLKGLKFEVTLPDGSKEKGEIDSSGQLGVQVDGGEAKMELTSLAADLKKER